MLPVRPGAIRHKPEPGRPSWSPVSGTRRTSKACGRTAHEDRAILRFRAGFVEPNVRKAIPKLQKKTEEQLDSWCTGAHERQTNPALKVALDATWEYFYSRQLETP